MTEIQKTVRLFGDETTIAVSFSNKRITSVRPIRGREKPNKIVAAVGRQIEAGKPIVEQHHNATVLQELLWHLLNMEDEA